MRKFLLLCVLSVLTGHLAAVAAMFSTSPAIVQESSSNVRILFDASQSDVAALKSATVLYAHIGVTLESAPSVWTHVIGDWNDNTDNKKFVKNQDGIWELPIGDIRTYFGLESDEKPAKIAVIARTADGKSQTADNFLDIYEEGFQMSLTADSPTLISRGKTICL